MEVTGNTQADELLKTPFFRVIRDNGYFVIEEPARENGVVIAAQREDGRFLVARLFRQAIGAYSYEFPRGAIDAGELALEAARREFQEETGYVCKDVTIVGRMHSNTSLLRSHVALTHVMVDTSMSPDSSVDGEVESVAWKSADELDQMIMSGQITDSHTLSTLLLIRTLELKACQ